MARAILAALALVVVAGMPAPRSLAPQVVGLSHIAVFVTDMGKARQFYEGMLGFEQQLMRRDGLGGPPLSLIKVNDGQWIEMIEAPGKGEGQLDHVALQVDDAAAMRELLASRGVKVPPVSLEDPLGNRSFTLVDPDGHDLEFVEYRPGGLTAGDKGGHLPSTRVSTHALHAGILVGDLDASMAFYQGILGFTEFWRGSAANSATLSWVNMRAPVGTDYLELMLYDRLPTPDARGSAHHLCLLVPDMEKALQVVQSRTALSGYSRPLAIRTGINRKRQLNLFDPDGTRVELMEPDTVDGQPAPSSVLPPPRRAGR